MYKTSVVNLALPIPNPLSARKPRRRESVLLVFRQRESSSRNLRPCVLPATSFGLGVPAARRPSGGRRAARGRAAALRAGGLPAALRSAGPAAAVPPTRSAPPHSGMPDRAPTPDQKTTHRSATHTWSAAHTSEPCLGQEAIGCCTEALEATAATAATAAGASQPPAHGQPAQHALG